jgi:microcystin-dependent protein
MWYLGTGTTSLHQNPDSQYWGLCDGTTYNNIVSPDLRDRFILAGDPNNVGVIGGNSNVILTIDQMPSHYHTFSTITRSDNQVVGADGFNNKVDLYNETTPGNVTSSTGNNAPISIMPPYYTLAYYIRVQ